jgi:hypothetical protein
MNSKLHELTPQCLQTIDNEMLCEVLTEIISIIWKVFHRTCRDKHAKEKIINP